MRRDRPPAFRGLHGLRAPAALPERTPRQRLRPEPPRPPEPRAWGWSVRRDRRGISCRPLCAHLVLAVHRRDVERFGVLARVGMLGAVVEMQCAHLVAPERPARDHALNRLFEDSLGEPALEDLAGGGLLEPARITGVLVVDLLAELAPGEADLVGIDHHDMIAAVDMRRVAGLVLAPQDVRDDGRDAADDRPS